MTRDQIEERLKELRKEAEKKGYRFVVTWIDEYGSAQSVTMVSSDTITLRKESKDDSRR